MLNLHLSLQIWFPCCPQVHLPSHHSIWNLIHQVVFIFYFILHKEKSNHQLFYLQLLLLPLNCSPHCPERGQTSSLFSYYYLSLPLRIHSWAYQAHLPSHSSMWNIMSSSFLLHDKKSYYQVFYTSSVPPNPSLHSPELGELLHCFPCHHYHQLSILGLIRFYLR